MANFAELNKNNQVIRVIVVHNNELLDNGVELESKGIAFCESLFGGKWIQTSYNTKNGINLISGIPIRKNFAGIGYTYDEVKDAFIPPKGFNSWILNEDTCSWEAPIPMPTDNKKYIWDEKELKWVEITK